MRAAELIATLGIDRATLKTWMERGLPHARRQPPRGRPAIKFEAAAVHRWLLDNGLAQAATVVATRSEVAEHFEVHTRTVADWLSRGCPGARGHYDLAAIEAWKNENRPEADPLLAGPQSPALEQYRVWKAKREQFAYERELGQWILRSEVHDALTLCFGIIRQAVENLQRTFGAEARALMAEAIDDAVESYVRTFGGGPAYESPTAEEPGQPAQRAKRRPKIARRRDAR